MAKDKMEEDDDEEEQEDDDKTEVMITTSSAWEMKNSEKAVKKLFANMLHFGYQLTVKTLKEGEIIDMIIVYGLAVSYQKKVGSIYKLMVNFNETQTRIEDFGIYAIRDAVNIIIEKVTKQ